MSSVICPAAGTTVSTVSTAGTAVLENKSTPSDQIQELSNAMV